MSEVRRRCVFYVSGFDPKGAAHYHALYKREAAKQCLINGWQLEVSDRQRIPGGNAFWSIQAHEVGGDLVYTHYEFMHWDDVVRRNWPTHTLSLWWDVVTTTLFNVRHGSLWQMFRLSWPPAVALFSPFVLLFMMLVAAPVLAALLAVWSVAELQWPIWAGMAGGVLIWTLLLVIGRTLESRYSMYWLTRSYAFTARQALGKTPKLEELLNAHAQRLVQRIGEQGDDEVLLVAHSSGAIMAVSILARAADLLKLQKHLDGSVPAKVSFMSLGQCIPLLACLPQAKQFRAELDLLGQTDWIDWIDFSAPPDGCCFALSDPMLLTGKKPCNKPKLLTPKFADMFEPSHYRALRKNKFRMHFQYLMAHDLRVDYDFFLITAANRTLATRYAHASSVDDFTALRPFHELRP